MHRQIRCLHVKPLNWGEMVVPSGADELTCSLTSDCRPFWKEEPIKLKQSVPWYYVKLG